MRFFVLLGFVTFVLSLNLKSLEANSDNEVKEVPKNKHSKIDVSKNDMVHIKERKHKREKIKDKKPKNKQSYKKKLMALLRSDLNELVEYKNKLSPEGGNNFFLNPIAKENSIISKHQIVPCVEDCKKKVIILALDGGGIRGIIPAYILAYIEAITGKKIHELFDVVGGTSTGGLIAAAIGVPDRCIYNQPLYAAKEIVEFYIKDKKLIFRKSKNPLAHGGLARAKYRDSGLEKFIKKRYTRRYRLGDMLTPVVLTGFDSNAKKLKLYSSVDVYLDETFDHRIYKAARVTAAAPTFFKSVKNNLETESIEGVKKEKQVQVLRDGGLIANNPSEQAYEVARKLFPHKQEADFIVISIGTGKSPKSKSHSNLGKINAAEIVQDFMSAQMAETDRKMSEKLGKNYVRIQANLDEKARLDDVSKKYLVKLLKAAQTIIVEQAQTFIHLNEVWQIQDGKHGGSYDLWRGMKEQYLNTMSTQTKEEHYAPSSPMFVRSDAE
ncbi:MAG: patatin-like phospholipase family protein [Alphaproteobacteria bacterium]|nr:patatin-like phospholipase family protein [Alphaproteobacteria bacterium]